MQPNDDWLKYDETKAIKYIRNYIPQELQERISDNDIDTIIEMMYNFYEEKGILDEGSDDDIVDIDVDELLEHINKYPERKLLKHLTLDDIELIVQGELVYCESLDLQD